MPVTGKLQVNDGGTSFELFDCAPGICQDGGCIGCELGSKECLDGNVVGVWMMEMAHLRQIEECGGEANCYEGSCLECFPGRENVKERCLLCAGRSDWV